MIQIEPGISASSLKFFMYNGRTVPEGTDVLQCTLVMDELSAPCGWRAMGRSMWESGPRGPMMLNMFDMWNSVSTKLEAQSNVQQSQQPHTSGGSIKGNFHLISRKSAPTACASWRPPEKKYEHKYGVSSLRKG